jgi:hypothetical protein
MRHHQPAQRHPRDRLLADTALRRLWQARAARMRLESHNAEIGNLRSADLRLLRASACPRKGSLPHPRHRMGGNLSAKGTHQMSDFVDSTGDDRVINNVMRHGYRVLTEREKETMLKLKDDGLAFWQLLDSIGSSRELAIAKTQIEEAVMWGVKHVTA